MARRYAMRCCRHFIFIRLSQQQCDGEIFPFHAATCCVFPAGEMINKQFAVEFQTCVKMYENSTADHHRRHHHQLTKREWINYRNYATTDADGWPKEDARLLLHISSPQCRVVLKSQILSCRWTIYGPMGGREFNFLSFDDDQLHLPSWPMLAE